MKFKKQLAWLFIPLLGILAFLCYTNSYTVFEPIVFQVGKDTYERIEVDSIFYKHLEFVLSSYHESYKIDKSGRLLIKRKLKSDEELIFNYTEKALDTAWLESNKP